jgi:hypothetical protein
VFPEDSKSGFLHPSNFKILEKERVAKKVIRSQPTYGISRIQEKKVRMRNRNILFSSLPENKGD